MTVLGTHATSMSHRDQCERFGFHLAALQFEFAEACSELGVVEPHQLFDDVCKHE